MTAKASLVGREPELAAMLSGFDRVADGSPECVLISGEAGIGKTRLVREFTGRVADRALVAAGGCIEHGSAGLPYAPFTAALRGPASSLGPSGIAELIPGGVGELARVLPGLGRPDSRDDDETARARLFEQILMLLAGLAAQRPVVLVIEDVHWAAASTRDLLDFLVRNQQAAPDLMIVVTYRSDELDRAHPLRLMAAELGRLDWVTHNDLPRLTRHGVAQQITTILGDEPDPGLVADVHRRSQGNPLFVEALLDESATGDARLSASLRDLLLAPVRRLPAQAQEVVRVAAVGGARLAHSLLARVAALDDAALSEALRAAVSGNVLVADGDAYVFRHALLREAVYEDQLPGDRVRAHLHYAEAIASDPGPAPDGRAAIDLAHHWFAAGELNKAFTAAWRAAETAGASLAFAEQLHMLTRVLELWPKVTSSAEHLGTDRRSVLERAIEAARLAGEAETGLFLADAALEEADGPARTARLLELRSGFRRALARDDDLQDLREAVRTAPADDPARASVLAALAARLLDIPHHEEARQAADEALELATSLGDTRTRAHALMLTAIVGARFGRFPEQRPYLHEAQQLAESIGAHDLLMRALHAEAHLLENYGEHAQAVEIGRRGMAAAADGGLARSLVGPHAASVAGSLISLGRWDEALDVTGEALELAPPPIVRAELMVLRATIALARGDTELPRNVLRLVHGMTGLGANLILPSARLEMGVLLLDDQAASAVAAAKRTLAEHDVSVSSRYAWPFLVLAAQAAAAAGDGEQAPDLIAGLHTLADELPVAGPVQRAHQLTFAAAAARADGRPNPEEEVDAWVAAKSAWERLGQPYRHAQALLGAAEVSVTAGDREPAVSYVTQALALADTLGAVPLRAAAEELATRAHLPVSDTGARQDDPAEQVRARLGLTSRELEVLRQVAAGRDNHEIASHLFISPKTVSVHVSHILDKLGLTNRTQAAATAFRLGLL